MSCIQNYTSSGSEKKGGGGRVERGCTTPFLGQYCRKHPGIYQFMYKNKLDKQKNNTNSRPFIHHNNFPYTKVCRVGLGLGLGVRLRLRTGMGCNIVVIINNK